MELIKILKYLDKKFPPKLMAPWDCAGLQRFDAKVLPDLAIDVQKIVICLDVTEAVVKKASDLSAQLIISRHPFIFATLQAEKTNPAKQKMIKQLMAHKVIVFSIHSNYDSSPSNDLINLVDTTFKPRQIKRFGNDQEGIEVILKQPLSNQQFQSKIDEIWPTNHLLGAPSFANHEPIKSFKIVTGAGGGSMIDNQLSDEVFVTGEAKWHEWLYAQDNKIRLLSLGHEMEAYFVNHLTTLLKNAFPTLTIIPIEPTIPYLPRERK